MILNIQRLEIQQDFFSFELGVDIVLGMEWLAELGDIGANFRELTFKVPTQGGIRTLEGESALFR